MTICSYQLWTMPVGGETDDSRMNTPPYAASNELLSHLQIASDGKFASARTISSPCPMRANVFSSWGDSIRGIPRKITIFSGSVKNRIIFLHGGTKLLLIFAVNFYIDSKYILVAVSLLWIQVIVKV